jgi:uncharacterized protein involved in outer membrane biogenesis
LLIGAIAALGLAAAAPWLVPTGAWRAPVEEAASKALGAPVKVGGLAVFLLPWPHLTVSDVDVGGGAIRLHKAVAHPALGSMFSAPRHLTGIELEKLDITAAGVGLLQGLAEQPSTGPAPVTIGKLTAKGVNVALAAGPLPGIDATVELGAGNLPRSALLATSDGKARLAATPDGEGWKLEFTAADWSLPMGPPLKFDQLKASGRVERASLSLPAIEAGLYGGKVTAKLDVAWEKGYQVAGDARVEGLDIAPLLQVLKLKAALAGRLGASGPFRARAAKPEALADALQAEFAFKVADGVLNGFDLAHAAQNLVKAGHSGGQTRFDQLSGNVQVAGRAVRLKNLKVASGALDARANVDVSAAKQLSGRIEVDLKGTGGLVGVPLAVSGTVADPVLMPTRGALAGAAIGTVLLPGVGTSLGSSIGDRIGKLFGK